MPHSTEAENGVLGSMLLSPATTISECAEKLIENHFFVPAHKTIYTVLLDLWHAGQAIDLITFTQALEDRWLLKAVGGAPFISHLLVFVPTAANVQYYIDIVREKYDLRRIISIGSEIVRKGNEACDLSEILAYAESEFPTLRSSRERRIRFFAPSELRDFHLNNELVLVGDCHIMRGEVFVIGGEPGVGKSRAATWLGVCGATGRHWFGLEVRRRFKTMIVQTENGRFRLKQEFSVLKGFDLEESIRVSEPPPFGLLLTNPEFQSDIRAALRSFRPDCVILDPWNAAAKDDKQRDYAETFDAIRSLLPTGDDKPALGIVAHTRKPQLNEKRTGGTCLQHLLAGSYVLSSVPRCIFVIVPGSEDEMENSVVWFNPKNNNGQKVGRSAWQRAEAGFTQAANFDWQEFDKPSDKRKMVTLHNIRQVFDGFLSLELKEAARRLAAIVGIAYRSAYNALSPGGKFSANLRREGGRLSFIENV